MKIYTSIFLILLFNLVTAQSRCTITITDTSTSTNCPNSTGTASVTPTSGTAPFTYLWNNGDTTSTILNLPANTYYVTVTDVNLCTAMSVITVNSSSVAPVTINANQTLMCQGDSAQICAPPGFSSYTWNTGETHQCIYAKLAGNYYITVTDNNTCTATSNHLAVDVYPLPSAGISVNGDTLTCSDAITYQWYFNGNAISGAWSPTYIPSQSGNYSVAATDTNGCAAFANSVFVLACKAHFTLYPDTSVPHHWFALNQATGYPLSYVWLWGDGDTSTGAAPSHTYASPDNYNVCLTISDTSGCTSTYCDSSTYIYKTDESIISVNVVSQLPTGISQISNPHSAFRISPNPATNTVTLSVDESMIGSIVTVSDITGRVMAVRKLETLNSKLETKNFANGVYFVTVNNGTSNGTKKLIVYR